MNLIEAVKNEQTEQNLNDAQLSRLLGIDPSLWCRIKKNQCGLTKQFLMAIMKNMPTLSLVVIDYMRGNAGMDSVSDTPETSLNKRENPLKYFRNLIHVLFRK